MAKKYTHENFLEDVSVLLSEYTLLSSYKNMKTKIKVQHNSCKLVYEVTPDNFKRGKRCPECSRKEGTKKRSHTIEYFVNKVSELTNGEYEVVGTEYINSSTPIEVRHNTCGKRWMVKPYHFISNSTRCRDCFFIKMGASKRKNPEEFVEEVKLLTNSEYVVLEDYINAVTKIKMKHLECESIYEVEPNAFLNGNRCPKCSKKNSLSMGERRIKDYLEKKSLKFAQQHTFDDCRNFFVLPFDFVVFDNGKVKTAIEFDGRHHFEPIEFWGGVKEFKRIKKCDEIKNDYCAKNDINIVRIPHWDFDNIENILDDLYD